MNHFTFLRVMAEFGLDSCCECMKFIYYYVILSHFRGQDHKFYNKNVRCVNNIVFVTIFWIILTYISFSFYVLRFKNHKNLATVCF
jgi:hypothetical protein